MDRDRQHEQRQQRHRARTTCMLTSKKARLKSSPASALNTQSGRNPEAPLAPRNPFCGHRDAPTGQRSRPTAKVGGSEASRANGNYGADTRKPPLEPSVGALATSQQVDERGSSNTRSRFASSLPTICSCSMSSSTTSADDPVRAVCTGHAGALS